MGFESWAWVFDKDGKQTPSSTLNEDCLKVEHVSVLIEKAPNSMFNEDAIDRSTRCGRLLRVETDTDVIKKNNLVWKMTTVLVDSFLIEGSLAKTMAMGAEYKGKQREEELQRAQKQGKPKL